MRATLSVLGLYSYDNSIFDGLVLPKGVDRDTLVQSILLECSSLEVLLPNPKIMKQSIYWWSNRRWAQWERLSEAMSAEYDPISNYDRHEEWSDEGNGEGENKNYVRGMNNSAMLNNASSNGASRSSSKHKGRVYGNVGVTTSAQMIEGELNLRRGNDMYKIITDEFKNEFCILVY